MALFSRGSCADVCVDGPFVLYKVFALFSCGGCDGVGDQEIIGNGDCRGQKTFSYTKAYCVYVLYLVEVLT